MAPIMDIIAVVHMHKNTCCICSRHTFILNIGLQRAGLRMVLCSLNLNDVVEVWWGHVWVYVCQHSGGE